MNNLKSASVQQENYKTKFLFANLIGYGYICLIIGFLLGIIIISIIAMAYTRTGAAAAKLLIIPGAALFFIVRSLWVKILPPNGRDLLFMEAPKFFNLIKDLRKQLRVPTIHKIKMTSDLNASIFPHPKLGILGFYENYLTSGLPLLETLSLNQFKIILAHEMCHISRKHGRSALWSFRVVRVWLNLSEKFETSRGALAFIFRPFLKKFIPFYRKILVYKIARV